MDGYGGLGRLSGLDFGENCVRFVCVERLDSGYKGSVGRTRSKFDLLDNWLKLCLFIRKKRLNLFMSVN